MANTEINLTQDEINEARESAEQTYRDLMERARPVSQDGGLVSSSAASTEETQHGYSTNSSWVLPTTDQQEIRVELNPSRTFNFGEPRILTERDAGESEQDNHPSEPQEMINETPYHEATLKELLVSWNAAFAESNKKKGLKIWEYLSKLMQNNLQFVSITDLYVWDLFRNRFLDQLEIQDINKCMFDAMKRYTDNLSNEEGLIAQKDLLYINKEAGNFNMESKAEIQNQIDRFSSRLEGFRSNARDNYNAYSEQLRNASNERMKISQQEHILSCLGDEPEVNVKMYEAVNAVVDSGKWIYIGWQSWSRGNSERIVNLPGGHYFITSQPLKCRHYDVNNGVNREIEFGYFLAILNKDGSLKKVLPCFNFRYNWKTSHPHVSDGNLCWGNMTSRLDTALVANYNYLEILSMVESVISEYCPDQPHRAYHHFEEDVERNVEVRLNCFHENMLEILPLNCFPEEIDKLIVGAIATKPDRDKLITNDQKFFDMKRLTLDNVSHDRFIREFASNFNGIYEGCYDTSFTSLNDTCSNLFKKNAREIIESMVGVNLWDHYTTEIINPFIMSVPDGSVVMDNSGNAYTFEEFELDGADSDDDFTGVMRGVEGEEYVKLSTITTIVKLGEWQ